MIGKLKGVLHEILGDEILIETSGGVFYKTYVTPSILQKYTLNDEVELYTYLNVREDELTLFAFESYDAHRIFNMLIGVDGVGPKMAYTIIKYAHLDGIRDAVSKSDVDYFQRIKGVGKKTAQRILVDLSGKLGEEFDMSALQENPEDEDVVDALTTLGFKRTEALRELSLVDKHLNVEEKIKQVLKNIGKSKK